MADKPGRARQVSDFLGLTQARADRQARRPGSKKWWLSLAWLFVIMVAAISLYQVLSR